MANPTTPKHHRNTTRKEREITACMCLSAIARSTLIVTATVQQKHVPSGTALPRTAVGKRAFFDYISTVRTSKLVSRGFGRCFVAAPVRALAPVRKLEQDASPEVLLAPGDTSESLWPDGGGQHHGDGNNIRKVAEQHGICYVRGITGGKSAPGYVGARYLEGHEGACCTRRHTPSGGGGGGRGHSNEKKDAFARGRNHSLCRE